MSRSGPPRCGSCGSRPPMPAVAHQTVAKCDGSHPNGGSRVSCQDVAGIMHSQINPGEADQSDQDGGRKPDHDFNQRAAIHSIGYQDSQTPEEARSKEGVTAGKAVRGGNGVIKECGRAWPAERLLEKEIEEP